MNPEDCFELGAVIKVHGLKGFVTVFLDTDIPERYYKLESVFLDQQGELIPFFIEEIKASGDPQKIHIKFEDITNSPEAASLVKSVVSLPMEWLPELGENQFYYHEVVGFLISDQTSGKSGPVINVIEQGGKAYFEMQTDENHVSLVPIEDDFIVEVNKPKKYISVRLPEGLLDL